MTVAAVALTLVGGYGNAGARPARLFHTAAALIAPGAGGQLINPREVIAPPLDIDPGMAIAPPRTGARMPVVAPPEAPGGRFGIER